ncbi:MAG: hypothetical protein B6A08_04350 [Sorangiineae bacterium NIC37A_2]|nr:MAG: hypothetical protein B6A08_04350 [Sorangiineae bacterium NIC37A_2]
MSSHHPRTSLVLNAVALRADWDAKVRVGRVDYVDGAQLDRIRDELGPDCVVRRRGASLELAAAKPALAIRADEVVELRLGDVTDLLAWRLSDWLIEHFATTGRQLFRRRRSLVVVSNRPDDDFLRSVMRGASLPEGLAFQAAFDLDVRVERPAGKAQVFLALDSRTRPRIDTPLNELLAAGVSLEGLYVRRADPTGDPRLADHGRLTGRVERVESGTLVLTDHDDGWATIPIHEARLEPRMEVLAQVLSDLRPASGSPREVLERLRAEAGRISTGEEQLKRIRSMAQYLRKQAPLLLDGHVGEFGKLIASQRRFPKYEIVPKPALIFDPDGKRTNRWNQGGLDQHGPFDRYQFNPKRLSIAVICQQELQGRVEQFVEQLLNGVPNAKGGDVGFLRRFALEKPYIKVFVAANATATEYRRAGIAAVEHITDRGESWNLALVQTEEAMEALSGDDNPYLTTKAFFLSKGIAVQHVHFETMNQAPRQRAYSLNNVGLACYAKLGGVPWLLPSDQAVAHELVVGIGSHHERSSRFGVGDRYVGITTVFSGDGRYLLESRTRAVPFSEYGSAMLQAVRAAVERVRSDFAWSSGDPVRLVFHAFKPMKDVEAQAVRSLMNELAIPHAEYAFLHVADAHPFQIFDENQQGQPAGRGAKKGIAAPPRGLMVHLSRRDALLCLKGARELKQAGDGHPAPLLLRLHRDSTFRDLTYLGRQAYAFACHSWRSFLPAPVPITILYSQLVAEGLRNLSTVSGWSDDAIIGRIGRTRWFL